MRFLLWLVALLLLCTSAQAESPGALPDSIPERRSAAELVRQLGDPIYQVREEAATSLLRLGRDARLAVQAGVKDSDLEVRMRCERLLPLMNEMDLRARIDAFVADPEGKQAHRLPGWDRYRALIGSDATARALYVSMLRSDSKLMEVADTAPADLGGRLAVRCQQVQQHLFGPTGRRQELNVGEVSAILFSAITPQALIPNETVWSISNLLYQPGFRQATSSGPQAASVRKLLLTWINHQTDPYTISQALNLVVSFELPEGLDLALRQLRKKEGREASFGWALVVVGKFGNREHLPLLAASLSDTTQIGTIQINNVRGNTQVRDIALAMMIHLSGQSIKEYGFDLVQNDRDRLFVPYFLGFSSDAKREAALKKWTEQSANLDKHKAAGK